MNNLAQWLIINTNGKLIAWYDNQWRIGAWLHGEFHPGLKFQPGFWNKSSENQIVDYLERDSARGTIQPVLKILARYSQTGLRFSAWPNWPENLKKSHVIETEFQPGPKKEREHAHWPCFCTSVNFLTEICARAEIEHVIPTIFQPGGPSEISARAETHHVIRLLEKYNQLHLLTIQVL